MKKAKGKDSGKPSVGPLIMDSDTKKMEIITPELVDNYHPTLEKFTPMRDYVMFERVRDTEHGHLTSSIGGILSYSEVSEIFGQTYPKVVKVGPMVKDVKVGNRVSFSAGFVNEIKVAKSGVRINSLIHKVSMGGTEYYLVSEAHIMGMYEDGDA